MTERSLGTEVALVDGMSYTVGNSIINIVDFKGGML